MAGVGFFLDSYDIFAINLVTALLGVVYWSGNDSQDGYGGNNGHLPNPVNQALKASTSAGIVVGMILFGWLAELVGPCHCVFDLFADLIQCVWTKTHVRHRAGHHNSVYHGLCPGIFKPSNQCRRSAHLLARHDGE